MELLAIALGGVSGFLAYSAAGDSALPAWAQWVLAIVTALPAFLLFLQRLIAVIFALVDYVKAKKTKDTADDKEAEAEYQKALDNLKEAIGAIAKDKSEDNDNGTNSK